MAEKGIFRFTCFCLISAMLAGCGEASSGDPVVTVGATSYSGVWSQDNETAAFLGVPFAEPPVGKRRWAPPAHVVNLPAAVKVDRFAPGCMQGSHTVDWYRGLMQDFGADPNEFPAPDFSEDCLYLNIWTPSADDAANLAVMVWIHGGSYTGGWSYEPNYIGDKLARHGVVVVSIAYRLDVFGFFSHPELEISNFGLLDQIVAFEWIKQNIRGFGGDPENITAFGESVGASSIGYLMVSPLSRGLFHRAIHQSNGYHLVNRDTRDDFVDEGVALQLSLLGHEHVAGLDELRGIDAKSLLTAAAETFSGYRPNVVVDGHSLTEPAFEAILNSNLMPVDLLVGTNAHEWRMYLDLKTTEEDVHIWIEENSPGEKERLQAILANTTSALHKLDRLYTGQQFVCPSIFLAEKISAANKRAYVYYFTKERSGEKGAVMGAYHGAEIPYIFNKHDDWLPTTAIDREITGAMGRYWTNFAKRGNPNFDGGTEWPQIQEKSRVILEIGNSIRRIEHPEQQLCGILQPQLD